MPLKRLYSLGQFEKYHSNTKSLTCGTLADTRPAKQLGKSWGLIIDSSKIMVDRYEVMRVVGADFAMEPSEERADKRSSSELPFFKMSSMISKSLIGCVLFAKKSENAVPRSSGCNACFSPFIYLARRSLRNSIQVSCLL